MRVDKFRTDEYAVLDRILPEKPLYSRGEMEAVFGELDELYRKKSVGGLNEQNTKKMINLEYEAVSIGACVRQNYDQYEQAFGDELREIIYEIQSKISGLPSAYKALSKGFKSRCKGDKPFYEEIGLYKEGETYPTYSAEYMFDLDHRIDDFGDQHRYDKEGMYTKEELNDLVNQIKSLRTEAQRVNVSLYCNLEHYLREYGIETGHIILMSICSSRGASALEGLIDRRCLIKPSETTS